MSIHLYEHNKETYENMQRMFEDSDRVGVVQPTGTGKSFLYLKWIEDNLNDRICVFSPSNEIFNQLDRYAAESGDSNILNNVEYITYQSLLDMSHDEILALNPDKIIFDEFHRTGAEQWGERVQQVLDAFSSAKVLGATATPVRYLDGARDMSAEIFEKNLARYMTLGEAVAKEILPMPKYVPVYYDVDGEYERQQQRVVDILKTPEEKREYEERVNSLKRQLEDSYGAEKMFKENMPNNHGKYIVFCRNNEHLETMKGVMKEWLKDVNGSVHMYKSVAGQDDDNKELYAFIGDNSANAVKLLFSIDRFNEGVHVPGIDGVIMLRPTTSPIIYLQQMGRALASNINAEPVIFDLVNNFESVKVVDNNGEEKNVFERDFAEFASPFQQSAFEKFGLLKRELNFNSLVSQLIDVLEFDNEKRWEQMLKLYVEFKEEYGRESSVLDDMYKGENLGYWVGTQRSIEKQGKLSLERKQKLVEVGFVFDPLKQKWEQMFELYVEFKNEYGREPAQREMYKGVSLGHWVGSQRNIEKQEKLFPERKQKLVEVGFVFDSLEQQWQQMFGLYVEFKNEYGREPAHRELFKGERLGVWVGTQRCADKEGVLSPERKQKLVEVGFVFDTFKQKWQQMFELYVEFKNEYSREPRSIDCYKGEHLGRWVDRQRSAKKRGTLFPEHKQKLIEAGFVFSFKQGDLVLEDVLSDASRRSAATETGKLVELDYVKE